MDYYLAPIIKKSPVMIWLIVIFIFGPFQTNKFEGGADLQIWRGKQQNFKHEEQHFCSPIKIHCGKSWSTTTSSMSSLRWWWWWCWDDHYHYHTTLNTANSCQLSLIHHHHQMVFQIFIFMANRIKAQNPFPFRFALSLLQSPPRMSFMLPIFLFVLLFISHICRLTCAIFFTKFPTSNWSQLLYIQQLFPQNIAQNIPRTLLQISTKSSTDRVQCIAMKNLTVA